MVEDSEQLGALQAMVEFCETTGVALSWASAEAANGLLESLQEDKRQYEELTGIPWRESAYAEHFKRIQLVAETMIRLGPKN
jgi:hypothetical protein